jgi:hypothetical protein
MHGILVLMTEAYHSQPLEIQPRGRGRDKFPLVRMKAFYITITYKVARGELMLAGLSLPTSKCTYCPILYELRPLSRLSPVTERPV